MLKVCEERYKYNFEFYAISNNTIRNKFNRRNFTTFLVSNGQNVDKLKNLSEDLDIYPGVTTMQGCTDTSLLVSMPAKEFLEKYMEKNNLTRYKSIKKALNAPEKTLSVRSLYSRDSKISSVMSLTEKGRR